MLISKNHLSIVDIASKDNSRPVLTCLKIEKTDEGVISVATDGYVLAKITEKTPDFNDFPETPVTLKRAEKVLLPAESAKNIDKAIKKNKALEVLNYAALGDGAVVTTDLEKTTSIAFQTVDGKYPEYETLMPKYTKENSVTVKLNPELLMRALKIYKNESSVDITIPLERTDVSPVELQNDHSEVKKTVVVMPLKS